MKQSSDDHRQVAVITGASQGIGLAIARRFVRNGYRVISVAREPATDNNTWHVHIGADLAHAQDLKQVASSLKKLDQIAVLVNCAGIAKAVRIEDTAWSDAKQMMDVNYFGALFMIQQCIPLLKKNGGGSIVNITSISGLTGFSTMGAYCASKFALTGLAMTAAKELAKYKIRVNNVCPGPTQTQMWDQLDKEYRQINGWKDETESEHAYMSKLLIKRMGHPDDTADAVEFLVSDRASYITGTNMKVCGGNMIG